LDFFSVGLADFHRAILEKGEKVSFFQNNDPLFEKYAIMLWWKGGTAPNEEATP